METESSSSLTEAQARALGENYPQDIYNESIASMFPKPQKKFLIGSDRDTYNSFQRKRKSLEFSKKCLGLLVIGEVNPDIVKLHEIQNLLEKFYCLPVRILPSLGLEKKKGNVTLIDNQTKQKYPMQTRKKSLNVFPLIGLLHSITPKDVHTIVSIIDHAIYDPVNPDDLIAGRACGSDGCVIWQDEDIWQFYSTIIHECGHTLGLGHCSAWKCLMNGGMSDFMQLCPMDLRKHQYTVGFDVLERYQGLMDCFKGKLWKKEKIWTEKMITALEDEDETQSGEGDIVEKKVKRSSNRIQ